MTKRVLHLQKTYKSNSMFYITGIVISLFLGFILLTKANKNIADKVLSIWLIFIGIHLLFFYLIITKKYNQFPFLLGLELPIPFLHGPFLYLYVTSLTNPPLSKRIGSFHFIPFLTALISLFSFFALPVHEKIDIYKNDGEGYELLLSLFYGGILLSGITYSLLSLRKLYHHKKNIGEKFSFTEKISLSWLSYLISGSVLIWLFVIFGTDSSVYMAVVLYVLFIGYFGIKQTGIFTNVNLEYKDEKPEVLPETENGQSTSQSERIKYEKSGLTPEQIESIHRALVQTMQSEKPYANPELTLNELSEQLGTHPNALSQVINSKEQRNFFDFINGYRIEAFKQIVMLPENQKFTLLSLAFECGFNSKTSFNRNFKKATGISPSEYLKQVNVKLQ